MRPQPDPLRGAKARPPEQHVGQNVKRAIQFNLVATPMAVRDAIARILADMGAAGIKPDTCSTTELVLAEVLNNVCEHAYHGTEPGPVQVVADLSGTRPGFVIRDRGHPVPAHLSQEPTQPDLDKPLNDLPEGGFGRFLVFSLTDGLRFSRQNGWNVAEFSISDRQ